MNCARTRELIQAFADQELSESVRTGILEHTAGCPSCAREVENAAGNAEFLLTHLSSLANTVRIDLDFLDRIPPAPPSPAGHLPHRSSAETTRNPSRKLLFSAVALVILAGIVAALTTGLVGSGSNGNEIEPTPRRRPIAIARRPGARHPAAQAPHRARGPVDSQPARPVRPARTDPFARQTPVQPEITSLIPKLLRSPSQTTLEEIWEGLERKPEAARILLAALDRAPAERTRTLLVLALAGAKNDSMVEARLLRLLGKDGSPEVRAAAAAALARSTDEHARRIRAAAGLTVPVGPIADRRRRSALLAAAESERDPKTLGVLVRALGPSQSEDGTITRRLTELVRTGDAAVRKAAIDAIRLGRSGDPSLVLDLVLDENIDVRDRVKLVDAAVLAEPGREIEKVREILSKASDDALKAAAVVALAGKNDPDRLRFAARILKAGETPALRRAALTVVAGFSSKNALEILTATAASEPDPGIRRAARNAARLLRKGRKRKR